MRFLLFIQSAGFVLSQLYHDPQPQVCPGVLCAESPKVNLQRESIDGCLVIENSTHSILYDCPEGAGCFSIGDGAGTCVYGEERPEEAIFPGEKCDPTTRNPCKFGPQKCNETIQICQGWGLGHSCTSSADCNPELYCQRGACFHILPLVCFISLDYVEWGLPE